MKHFLREIFKNGVTLALVASVFAGFVFDNNLIVLFLAATTFTLINQFLKPVIKIFFLPINIVTLGLFRWFVGVICLLFLTLVIPEIQVKSFQFEGISYAGFIIPDFYFNTLLSLIFASFIISFVTGFIDWLFKK